jgi:hypothetical protein
MVLVLDSTILWKKRLYLGFFREPRTKKLIVTIAIGLVIVLVAAVFLRYVHSYALPTAKSSPWTSRSPSPRTS